MDPKNKHSHPFHVAGLVNVTQLVSEWISDEDHVACILTFFFCASIFISIQLSPRLSRRLNSGTILSEIKFACTGINAKKQLLSLIASSYTERDKALQPSSLYLVSGRVIWLTSPKPSTLYYQPEVSVRIGDSKDFEMDVTDKMNVFALGIIISRTEIRLESKSEKKAIICYVRHSDFDNEKTAEFDVQYRVNPTRDLAGISSLFQVGKEVEITGYIIDWDKTKNNCVVNVTGVSVTSGHQSPEAVAKWPELSTFKAKLGNRFGRRLGPTFARTSPPHFEVTFTPQLPGVEESRPGQVPTTQAAPVNLPSTSKSVKELDPGQASTSKAAPITLPSTSKSVKESQSSKLKAAPTNVRSPPESKEEVEIRVPPRKDLKRSRKAILSNAKKRLKQL
ncbi:hypothetical protein O181_010754 [Austropuccinia psidii MF-1]|uniref:Uncharacterized protein n=1 Tax=Austropuccinia psidii MF-1 TaxID=1389203 RepID=A0A9Q3GL65_9BASI|nr:hypothetical protein [Austropuccinia psidii MF-1]